MNARNRRAVVEDAQARRSDLTDVVIELRLRRHQITDRYGDAPAPGWVEAMDDVIERVEQHNNQLREELRAEWVRADDETRNVTTIAWGPQGRVTQRRMRGT